MRALGFAINKSECERCFKEVDKDFSYGLTYEEFVQVASTRIPPKNSKEELLKIFRLFDDDNTGKISIKNLRRVSTELNENIPDEELQDLIREADRTGDGLISFEEFY